MIVASPAELRSVRWDLQLGRSGRDRSTVVSVNTDRR